MENHRALTDEEMKRLAARARKYLGNSDLLRAHFGSAAPEQLHDLALSSIRQAYAAWQQLDGVDHIEEAYGLSDREIINHAAFKSRAEKAVGAAFKAPVKLPVLGSRISAVHEEFPFINSRNEPTEEPVD